MDQQQQQQTVSGSSSYSLSSDWANYDMNGDGKISHSEMMSALSSGSSGGQGQPSPGSGGGVPPGGTNGGPGGTSGGPPTGGFSGGVPGAGFGGAPPGSADGQGGFPPSGSGSGPGGGPAGGPGARPGGGPGGDPDGGFGGGYGGGYGGGDGGGFGGPGAGGGLGGGPGQNCRWCAGTEFRQLSVLQSATEEAFEHLILRRLQSRFSPNRNQGVQNSLPCCDEVDSIDEESDQESSALSTGSAAHNCGPTKFWDRLAKVCVFDRCQTPNTAPNSDGICEELPAEALKNIDPKQPVEDKLRLTGLPAQFDVDEIMFGGRARNIFEANFKKELAKALGIAENRLEVSDLSEGSIIVTFKILPPQVVDESNVNNAPQVVLLNLNAIKLSLSQRAPANSMLAFTDGSFGQDEAETIVPEEADSLTGEEALMQSFDGELLSKVPRKTVENPEVYTLSPVGIGDRSKINEYRPKDRHKFTQDEKWESRTAISIDLGIFISPAHAKISESLFCPRQALKGDPVKNMWDQGGAGAGFGGNFQTEAKSPEMSKFRFWRMAKDRHMSLTSCKVSDWLERAVPGFKINSEEVKNSDCGLPDGFWANSTCADMDEISSSHADSYRPKCNTELFPSKVLEYTTKTPINGKWIMQDSRASGFYKPEWILDTLHSFHFTWDKLAEFTENEYAKKAPAGGDWVMSNDQFFCEASGYTVTPCPQKVLYSGRTLYKGTHFGDNKKVLKETGSVLSQIPASSPVVKPVVMVRMDIDSTIRLIKRAGPKYWPKDEDVLREILSCNTQEYLKENLRKCGRLGLHSAVFPYIVDISQAIESVSQAKDKAITLRPGFVIVLDIVLNIQPLYVQDTWGSTSIRSFYIDVERIAATESQLAFNKRNEGHFRVKFSLNPKVRSLMQRPQIPFLTLVALAGSWMGIWVLCELVLNALFKCLKMWGNLGPQDSEHLLDQIQAGHNKKCDLERKMAARQIKLELEEEYAEYNIKVDMHKVMENICNKSKTRGLRQKVLLRDVLKAEDPYESLPEHVQGLIGEVHVHLQGIHGPTHDADSEQGDQEELEEVERELKRRRGSACCGLIE
eukprot:TRINITY_DN1510_c2_g1_i1.p1 TRINITY_DN1510_c2_g1~~TRINITY_DN1510_c2_g1_i1.p1  ORF type:complete len:1139 (-),score=228.16 TRINITY_DN1510_c2_g1_i1:210-3443(-)